LGKVQYFPLLCGISLASCLIAAYVFPPAPDETLKNFYRRVRPFGRWGPVRRMLADAGEDPNRPRRDRFDIPIAIVATSFFVVLYLMIIDVVLHNWPRAACLAVLVAIGAAFLYVAWWRRLDPTDLTVDEPSDARP
jgi:hypothetical protein